MLAEPTPYTLSHQQGVKIIQQKEQVLLFISRTKKFAMFE